MAPEVYAESALLIEKRPDKTENVVEERELGGGLVVHNELDEIDGVLLTNSSLLTF